MIESNDSHTFSLNKFLPKDEQEYNEKESSIQIKEIIENLSWSLNVNDMERGVSFYCKSFQNWLLLREPMGLENAKKMVEIFEKLISLDWLDNVLLSKFIESFIKLLHRCRQEKITPALNISWRNIYDLIENRIYSDRYRGIIRGEKSIKNIKNKLIELAKELRKWKRSSTSTEEILKLIKPLICPKEKIIYKAVGYLGLFLPANESNVWFNEIMEIWKSMKGDDTWNSIFINLVLKSTKNGLDIIDYNAHFDYLFSQIQSNFKVGLSDKLPKVSNVHECPRNYSWIAHASSHNLFFNTGKLLVKLLSSKHSSVVFEKITALFSTLEIYCNPSNSGDWAKKISDTIHGISFFLSKKKKKNSNITEVETKILEQLITLNTSLLHSKTDEVSETSRKTFYNMAQINKDFVLPKILEIIYTGLEAYLATHQIVTSFELLALLSGPLFDGSWEDGSKHLSQILRLSLSGIDFNDPKKTQATLKFYYSLFSVVPIADKFPQPKNTFQSQIADSSPFSEWIYLFIENLIYYLSNHTREKEKEHQNWQERTANMVFEQTINVIFSQLSPSLHKVALEKFSQQIQSSIQLDSQKEYKQIFFALSFASPKTTLAKFIPICTKKLFSDKTLKKSLSESEISWWLGILSSCIKWSGENLLDHFEFITSLIDQALYHEKERVRDIGNKILRKTLFSLSRRYFLDFRSSSQESLNKDLWETWGKKFSYKTSSKTEVNWHISSEKEIKASISLSNKLVTAALENLNKEDSKSELLINSLNVIRSILASLSGTILFEGEEPENRKNDGFAPISKFKLTPYVTEKIPGLRKSIGTSLQTLSKKLEHSEDVNLVKLLCQVIRVYLDEPFVFHGKLKYQKTVYWMFKKKWEMSSENKLLFRNLLQQRVYCQHLRRLFLSNSQIGDSPINSSLLETISNFSLHPYVEVRRTAQRIYSEVSVKFPLKAYNILPLFLSKLSDPNSTKEVVEGSIQFLLDGSNINKISKKWKFTKLFLNNICNSHVHSESSTQLKIYQLFLAFLGNFYSKLLQVPLPRSNNDSGVSQENLQSAVNSIQKKNGQNLENYRETIISLNQILNGKLHWRYQLMATSALLFLIHKDEKISPQTLTQFSKSSVSDIAPLRKMSLFAIELISQRTKTRRDKTLVENVSAFISTAQLLKESSSHISSGNEWDSYSFHDSNLVGYTDIPTNVYKYKTSSKSQLNGSEEFKPILEFLKESSNLKKFLNLISNERHDLGDKEESSKKNRLMSMASQFLGGKGASHFMGGNQNEQDLSGKIIDDLLKSEDSISTTFGSTSSPEGFRVRNASLFKSIIQSMGFDFVQNTLYPLLLENLENKERSEQCTAIELISALLRSSKHWSFEENKKLAELLTKPLKEALSKASPESIEDWVASFRYSASKRDPKRLEWIIELFSKDPLEGNTSLSKTKNLLYLSPFLSEFSWRGISLARSLLSILSEEKVLNSDYKQIRLAVSEVISISLSCCERNGKIDETAINTIEKILRICLKENVESNVLFTVINFIHHTVKEKNRAGLLHGLFDLVVDVTFRGHLNEDKEVQQLAKVTTALLAQTILPEELFLNKLQPKLAELSQSTFWHLRSAVLPFLQIVLYHYRMTLDKKKFLENSAIILNLLKDPHVEVREIAKDALTSFFTGNFLAGEFLEEFDKLALLPIPSRNNKKQKLDEENNSVNSETLKKNIVLRHSGVLGLCSIVLSQPYTMPSWLPDVVDKLGGHLRDPSPISDSVKKTISEFFRTHQDNWVFFQSLLTYEQSSALSELKSTVSPYNCFN